VVEQMERGQAQKADPTATASFFQAVLPLLATGAHFTLGSLGENSNFKWIIPPDEPIVKEKKTEDKNREPEAPTLQRKPNPNN